MISGSMRLSSNNKVSLAVGFSLLAAIVTSSCGFNGHSEEVTSVAFSPDGQYLLTSGHDGTARLWDLKTGAEVRRFLGGDESVHRARFTPDGQFIVACGSSGIIVWNATHGAEITRVSSGCIEVAVSIDGKKIAAGQFDSLKVWDTTSGKAIRLAEIKEDDYVSCFEFSLDGKQLVFVSEDSEDRVQLNFLAIDSGEVKSFPFGNRRIEQIAPLRDSSIIILGDADGYVHFWDLTTKAELNKFKVHQSVNAIYPLPDGDHVLSTSYEEFSLWSMKEARVLRQFRHDALFTALSTDGRQVASVDQCNDALSRLFDSMRSVRVWDLETGTTTLTIPYKCPFRVGFH